MDPMQDIGSPLATILHQNYQSDMHDLYVLKLVTLMLYTTGYYYQSITNVLADTVGSYTLLHITIIIAYTIRYCH